MCDGSMNLPPGFRFLPTDEELVLHFLHRKASLLPCHPNIIPDLPPYFLDPWQLNGKALCSGTQWYFFSQMMENYVTENGYWKPLEVEEPIFNGGGKKVGLKKFLVFFIRNHEEEDPSGIETNWVMQQYHLCSSAGFTAAAATSNCRRKGNRIPDCYKWVLCRVYEREANGDEDEDEDNGTELSCLDEMFLSLDEDLADISLPNNW